MDMQQKQKDTFAVEMNKRLGWKIVYLYEGRERTRCRCFVGQIIRIRENIRCTTNAQKQNDHVIVHMRSYIEIIRFMFELWSNNGKLTPDI